MYATKHLLTILLRPRPTMQGRLKCCSSQISRTGILVLCTLAISILFNVLTILRLKLTSVDIDDSQYTYIGDDHPTELPLHLDTVALTFNASEHYGTSNSKSWRDWNSLDTFPRGHGFVSLGPNARVFGVSMFHQIHCLQMIRLALINGPNNHSRHCLNMIRMAVLCRADITLDPLLDLPGINATDGLGVTHICRDWTQVYDYIIKNHNDAIWPS